MISRFLYLGVIVPASVTIPLAIAIARFKYIGQSLKIIFLYLLMAGITNCIAAFLAFTHRNNLPLLHIYTILELILFGLFFYKAIDNRHFKKWVRPTILLFTLSGILNFIFIQSIYSFNSYPRSLEAIILIVFSVFYFYLQTAGEAMGGWYNRPETWIIIGILLYFSSALVQFSFSNIVSTSSSGEIKRLIWNIHASLVLIMYLLFAVGFIKCKT
jgi:hypothetical protein